MIRSLGAVLLSTVCTDNLQAVQPATSYIFASRGTDAHRVTAVEGYDEQDEEEDEQLGD